jgi:hypothetical protein
MVDSIEKPDQIADNNPQLQEQETPQQQIVPGDRARAYRRDAAWVLGAIGGILSSIARREVDHPHDYWVAAIGASCLFAAICLYLYDVFEFRGRGRTLIMIFGAMAMISAATADRWTREFSTQRGVLAEKSPPKPTPAIPRSQFIQPAFHEKIDDLQLLVGSLRLSGGPSPIFVAGMVPPRLRVDNGVLYIDVVVRGGSLSEPAIVVHDNEFVVKPLGWDRNSNINALEVVNEADEPILQLIRVTPSAFRIMGIFPLRDSGWPKGSVWYSDDRNFGVRTPDKPFPPGFKLKPIFKYPAWKYPGKYADNSD